MPVIYTHIARRLTNDHADEFLLEVRPLLQAFFMIVKSVVQVRHGSICQSNITSSYDVMVW